MHEEFPRILIIDDQKANVTLLQRLLNRRGYSTVKTTTDSREVFQVCAEFGPDLILLDLFMPFVDGFAILAELRRDYTAESYVPILVLTADISLETKQRALDAGATDFITKPFDATEVVLRTRNLLETRWLYLQQHEQNEQLEQRVRERTQELEGARLEIVTRLARAAEYRDDVTGAHIQRVARLAGLLADAHGLPADEVVLIEQAAPLHDVGKIGIPDHILLKPGKLTFEEFEFMKTHTTLGAGILAGSQHPLLQYAEIIALTHHERWDGKGYPQRFAGEAIPIAGRIVALADVFDALTSERPYKVAWSADQAIEEIIIQSGKQFDPALVESLVQLYELGMLATPLILLPSVVEAHSALPFTLGKQEAS